MNDQDQLERMLGRELHDRADGLSGVPFGFDDVKGRAGRIRRNRRIAASVAVAAAVGVIVPTVMTVSGSLQSQREIPPAPQPDQPVEIARTTLSLDGLERGEDPAVEYFTPDGVVLPGEGLQELEPSYQAMVPSVADGGWVAVEPDGQEVRLLTTDFEPTSGTAKNLSFETTPDRNWYAFVAVEAGAERIVVRSTQDPGAGQVWDLPQGGITEVVGFVAPDRVVYETIDQTDGSSDLGIAEPDGSFTDLPDYVKAVSADPVNGLIAVQTKSNDDGSGCFGVIDPDTAPGRPVWDTCANSLGTFSPDGRYLMASDSYLSGEGPVSMDVVDAATGTKVARFTPASDDHVTLLGPTWEDGDSIVSPAYEGTVSTIIRMDVDGTLEDAVDRVEGWEGDRYFYLGQDRRGM